MAVEEIASLVKYCSIETGLKILNSQSLRWSAPHLFHDPFEPDHLSAPDFTPESLLEAIIKEAISMLFGPSEPSGKSNRLVAAIARWRDEERFASEDEAAQVLNQLLSQVAEQMQEGIDEYLSDWQTFAREIRICSFSDKPNNMACWQRYAENHAGIALRFKAGAGTALANTHRISYSTSPPLITSLQQQVAVTYGREAAPASEDFQEKLLLKNKANNVEREWRCFNSEQVEADSDEQLWYNNKPFTAGELRAIYLGLGTSREDRDSIIQLARKKYGNSKVYQAKVSSSSYGIEFEQVDTR